MEETEATEKVAGLSYKIKDMTLCYLRAGFGGEMAMTRDWATYGHWHELLDGLCTEQGYPDNMALADALCAASGNRTQAAFDTAVKNLRNWRHGVHIPQRKNFILLGKILKVDRDEALRQVWSRLYRQAKVKPGGTDIDTGTDTDTDTAGADAASEPVSKARKSRWPFMVGGVIVAGVLVATALVLASNPSEEVADPVASYEGIVAEYVRHVSIKVGDSAIIHGARGNECDEAPTWESAKLLLPELVTGTLTDGGVGTRQSRQCGGRVAARAILFTATRPGTEQISLYGDDIVIRVSE